MATFIIGLIAACTCLGLALDDPTPLKVSVAVFTAACEVANGIIFFRRPG